MFHNASHDACVTRRSFLLTGAAMAATLGLAGCGSSSNGSSKDDSKSGSAGSASSSKSLSGKLVVFAAASLTESLTAAGKIFMKANPDVDITYNYDSSGTLKTQIQNGADCDVFISAGQLQMDQLDVKAKQDHEDGLDFVNHATRFDILENKVCLCVPDNNPKGIKDFGDMSKKLEKHSILLCMGNSDVPVGQYTQKILAYYKLDEQALANAGCITYGSNVKEVASQVREAAVDCGVVYRTDAVSEDLKQVDQATEKMCGRVVYPAAAIKTAPNPEVAKAFLAFLKGPRASKCFEKVGFTPLAEG